MALVHEKLVLATLSMFTAFLDWIPLSFVNSTNIIQILCSLILERNIRAGAAECLLVLVDRKFKAEERDFILPLFLYLDFFLQALNEKVAGDITEEVNYSFQKRVCQILVDVGTAVLLSKTSTIPENFPKYLDILLIFYAHPSHMLSSFVVPFWLACFKAPLIAETQAFQQIFPTLLQTSCAKLLKVGEPDKSNSPSCKFSLEDFETVYEFRKFFSVYRSRTLEVVKHLAEFKPVETMEFICRSLEDFVRNVYRTGQKLTVHDEVYIIWEARSTIIENVFTSLTKKSLETPLGVPALFCFSFFFPDF